MTYNANTLFPVATRPRAEGIGNFTYRTADPLGAAGTGLAVTTAAGDALINPTNSVYFDTVVDGDSTATSKEDRITEAGVFIKIVSTHGTRGGTVEIFARRRPPLKADGTANTNPGNVSFSISAPLGALVANVAA